ncbi:MAG: type II secretion system minor pseudopilin GspH [Gammaproteobacteria bacterium]|nr:type II secretion system minor pseudopilin GspH [Gammaproteobacteria bacterium]
MPRSTRMCERGFTLIEIMVVMLVIGIIMSLATLSINLNQSNILEDEIKRMRSLTSMASEEAIMQGDEMAVEMHSNGYQFLRLMQSGEQWQWTPVKEDKLFRPRCFPPGLDMKLELEGEPATLDRMSCDAGRDILDKKEDSEDATSKLKEDNENEIPRIFLLSSGELTPFIVTLVWEDGSEYKLSGELTGELELLAPDDDEI